MVATRETALTLFKILLNAENTAMLAKYTGAFEQGEEEVIEKN